MRKLVRPLYNVVQKVIVSRVQEGENDGRRGRFKVREYWEDEGRKRTGNLLDFVSPVPCILLPKSLLFTLTRYKPFVRYLTLLNSLRTMGFRSLEHPSPTRRVPYTFPQRPIKYIYNLFSHWVPLTFWTHVDQICIRHSKWKMLLGYSTCDNSRSEMSTFITRYLFK